MGQYPRDYLEWTRLGGETWIKSRRDEGHRRRGAPSDTRIFPISLCMQSRLLSGAARRQTVSDRLAGTWANVGGQCVNAGGPAVTGQGRAEFLWLLSMAHDLRPVLPQLFQQREQLLYVRYTGPETHVVASASGFRPCLRIPIVAQVLAHARELVGMKWRDDRQAAPAEGFDVHGG